MNRAIPCLLCLVLGACLHSQTKGGAEQDGIGKLIPSRYYRHYFFVTLQIGSVEKRSLNLLLDTGASKTTLDLAVARRLTGKNVTTSNDVILRDATIGPLRVNKLSADIADLKHLSRGLRHEIDGILGFDAFRSLQLVMDYPRREVRVSADSVERRNGETLLNLRDETRPFVRLDLAGEWREILIDTGSGSCLVVRSGDFPWETEPRLVGGSLRLKRIDLRRAGRMKADVRFGPARLHNPIVAVVDRPRTELMGTSILRHLVLRFDHRARVVAISQPREGDLEFPSVRDLAWVLRPNDEGFEVVRLFGGGPADRAGVKVGDLLTHVAGRPVLEPSDVVDWQEKVESVESPIQIYRLRRDGAIVELSMRRSVLVRH